MRAVNEKLDRDNNLIQRQIDIFTAKGMLDVREIFSADRDRLIVAHITLLQQYRLFCQRNKGNLERLQRLQVRRTSCPLAKPTKMMSSDTSFPAFFSFRHQNSVIEKNELGLKVARLSDAHASQNSFIRTLKAKIKEMQYWKDCVRRNEKATQHIEKMIEEKARGAGRGATTKTTTVESPVVSLLRKENEGLELKIAHAMTETTQLNNAEESTVGIDGLYGKLQELKSKQQELREENVVLTNAKGRSSRRGSSTNTLIERAVAAEERAEELERELMKMVEEMAEETSAIELQVLARY